MADEEIRNELQRAVGIQPCQEWLEACFAFLRPSGTTHHRGNNNDGINADSVMFQILHADLRDVIRSNLASTPTQTSSASQQMHNQLQRALALSKQGPQTCKQQLSNDFLLLCQVEELVNVALSTEARAAHTLPPFGSVTAPPPTVGQRNIHKDCFKLFLSDGHFSDNNNNNNNQNPIIAMTIASIPNLGPTQTLAGCKLLLRGPIVVRWGMLQLHPGNATVLGGCVDELVAVQRKAFEQAKRNAGVGVDATIRALIGNNPMETEEPSDEADQASGDVLAVPMPMPAQIQQPMPSHSSIESRRSQPAMPQPPPPPHVQAQAHIQTVNDDDKMDMVHTSTSTSTQSSAPRAPMGSGNPYTRSTALQQSNYTAAAAPASPPSTFNDSSPTNPYTRPSGAPVTHASDTTTTAATNTTAMAVSRHATSLPTANSNHNNNHNPYQSSRSSSTQNKQCTAENVAATNFVDLDAEFDNDENIPTLPPPSAIESTNASSTTSISYQKITHANLHKLLQQLVQNRSMYENYKNQLQITFEVVLQQQGGKMDFNIAKSAPPDNRTTLSSSSVKKPKKQYEFVISATFGGTGPNLHAYNNNNNNNSNNIAPTTLLSCKLPSRFIEPHFAKPPAELRTLSRENRSLSVKLVEEGGERIKKAYFERPQSWKATLYPTADQVFGTQPSGGTFPLDDVNNPILLLEPLDTTSTSTIRSFVP